MWAVCPKKLMFMAAGVRETMVSGSEIASGFGYQEAKAAVGDMRVDWEGLKTRRDAYVKRLNGVYEGSWKKLGIDVRMGFAKLLNADGPQKVVEITAADGTKTLVTAAAVVLAVGGEPSIPSVPGAGLGISSDGFFDLPTQPLKCGVFGAGYIAVEMAGILSALGTETTLFCRGDKVLRDAKVFDTDIVGTLISEMAKHGPTLRPGSDVKDVSTAENGTFTVVLKDDSTHTGFDCILWAIGRHPVTGGMGLEEAGIEMSRGFIKVDEYENTSVPGVYAIGDVTTTGWELTPVAIASGRRLADRLYGAEPLARMYYKDIPTVLFSHPPIGTVGYTEAAAIEEFGAENITVKKATFGSMTFAFNPEDEHKVKTTLKLVLFGEDELIVGLHMIGPQSDEMLQGFAVAVKMGATRADFEATVAIHPTIGEEMVTFGGWGQKDGMPQLPPLPSAAKQAAQEFLANKRAKSQL